MVRASGPPCASGLIAAAGLAGALTALAQPEQWLEYHTSPEPQGYRWLELSTNPPPDVAWPKLQPAAYYGRWTNGLETAGGRWFCLDRTRKSGPCDRLFFDANGTGRLDDDSAITTTRRDDNATYFEPVKVVFKGEDGPISYHLVVRFYQFDKDRAQLLAGAGGWYEGKVTLAGKKRTVRLMDNTVNGAFDDVGEAPGDCDRITVGGEEGVTRYLGRYLEVDGQLLRLEVARDGAFLKVKPAEGVVWGTVRVPETITEFTAVGTSGHFVRKPEKGEFKLPVGKYRVDGWQLERKDDKGAKWMLSGYGFGVAASFQVSAGNAAAVHVGEPVYAAVQMTETRSDLGFSLSLLGSLGENVQIMRGSERPRAPQLQVASAKGDFKATRNFEYG
jgi:hypothetical protein